LGPAAQARGRLFVSRFPFPVSRLYAAAGLRSFVIGLVGVLLGLHLAATGLGAELLGLVVGAGLAGGAVATALVAFGGDRWGRRATLVTATALSAAGLAGVALLDAPAPLALAAFIGMVNGMGRDRGPAQALEQSVLADGVADGERTRAFTRYTLVQDVSGACGALAAGVPAALGNLVAMPLDAAYRWTLGGAALLSLVPLALYAGMTGGPGAAQGSRGLRWGVPLGPDARRRVGRLAGLFALDSLGGGFLAGSIVTYWFFRRFGMTAEALGLVFFAARCLNAVSYLAAERLAGRIGLVRTMVFTHLPSSAVLLALPFVATPGAAIGLFLVREALVQMDVPARQSYVAAVTGAGERTFALGITALVRNVGWAVGPALAGVFMATLGLGAPLLAGAGLKVVYDLALFGSFRHVRPPEEEAARARH
jgi:MFS family permease